MRPEQLALQLVSQEFRQVDVAGQSKVPGAPHDMPLMWLAMLADDALGGAAMELP